VVRARSDRELTAESYTTTTTNPATTWRTRGTDPDEKLTGKDPDKYGPWRFDVDLKLEIDAPILVNRARIDCSAHLLVSIELVRSGIPLTNECDCKEFRKWLLPCEHMLEGFLYGDAVEPDWDKYSSLFLDQKFDVYEGKRTEMVMDAGGGFPGRSEYGEDAGK
jgi:hypothetical protein